jgi:hypothetical protein
MPLYRVYFLDSENHIIEGQYFEAAGDEAAIAQAARLCTDNEQCVAVEIWQGPRRLHRHQRSAA